MKTRLSLTAKIFACLFIAGVPGFWGCASMDGDEKGDNDMKFPQEVVEAVDISSFPNEGCHWQYTREVLSNKVYIINSEESLSKFVSCHDSRYDNSQIADFNKKTLLFVYGYETHGVSLRSYKLIQLSQGEFQLDVEVEDGMFAIAMPTTWIVAVLIPKIAQDATINLSVNVTQRNSDENQTESSETLLWAEGYIVDKYPCGTENGEPGYCIITDKDTLLAFNFPESLNLPENFGYERTSITDQKSKYKVRISYEISHEDKIINFACPAIYNLSFYNHAIQVITKSATKID
jgi:hypothetical protein